MNPLKAFTKWLREHKDVDENESYSTGDKERMWLGDRQMFRGPPVTRGSKMVRDEGMDYTPGSVRRRRERLKQRKAAKRSRRRNRQ